MVSKIFLYAFDSEHRCVSYRFVLQQFVCVRELYIAADGIFDHPGVVKVVAIDDFPDLYWMYKKATSDWNDYAEHIAFEDMVTRRGLLIRER